MSGRAGPAVFDRVAVLGLGLLGGSLALAAKRRGAARVVVGATRRRDALDVAVRIGAVDETAGFEEAVRDADLVVLATPVFAMSELLEKIAPQLRAGAIVTDVGSVKGGLAETLPGLLPAGTSYVGSHPMAGSHHRGIEYADARLFEGAACVVTGSPASPATEKLCALWRALGSRVVVRDPVRHDTDVAWVSHLPHALAFAFGSAFAQAGSGAGELAGQGFRDFTRIAHSDPELWADILTQNRKALAAPLQRASETLAQLARSIEANDTEAVERCIGAAREALTRATPDPPATRVAAGACDGRTAPIHNPEPRDKVSSDASAGASPSTRRDATRDGDRNPHDD